MATLKERKYPRGRRNFAALLCFFGVFFFLFLFFLFFFCFLLITLLPVLWPGQEAQEADSRIFSNSIGL
jgi:hypothetical protein